MTSVCLSLFKMINCDICSLLGYYYYHHHLSTSALTDFICILLFFSFLFFSSLFWSFFCFFFFFFFFKKWQKERDLELAAHIGQSLLQENKELKLRNQELEAEIVNTNETVNINSFLLSHLFLFNIFYHFIRLRN